MRSGDDPNLECLRAGAYRERTGFIRELRRDGLDP
jgi:hypothetical protein